MILKVQPRGSKPSKRGTSNLILWVTIGVGDGDGVGEDVAGTESSGGRR